MYVWCVSISVRAQKQMFLPFLCLWVSVWMCVCAWICVYCLLYRVWSWGSEWLVEIGWQKGRGGSLLDRDRFSHKSTGWIHTLPRTIMVCAVKTQESLRAGPRPPFVFRSGPSTATTRIHMNSNRDTHQCFPQIRFLHYLYFSCTICIFRLDCKLWLLIFYSKSP